MNLNRSVLVAMVMMVGSVGAIGCKSQAAADPSAPVDEALAATTDDTQVIAQASITIPAPPAPKEEIPGAAPSDHHIWSPGYWHYDHVQTLYVWEPGYWQDRTLVAPVAPPPLREEIVEYQYAPAGDYFWAPGSWRWTGTEYLWAPGYWAPRLEGWGWVRPYWVSYGGRWECHGWGWERRTAGWGRDRDDWSRRDFSRHDREDWERRNRDGWAARDQGDWDRREHEHRVDPATVHRDAQAPRHEEILRGATVAAHAPVRPAAPREHEQPAAPRSVLLPHNGSPVVHHPPVHVSPGAVPRPAPAHVAAPVHVAPAPAVHAVVRAHTPARSDRPRRG